MDEIKLKMDNLVKDKIISTKLAVSLEAETKDFENKCKDFETEVRHAEKQLASSEDDLDKTLTDYIDAQENLENAIATASTAELEVNALNRKIKLIEDEQMKIDERYRETIAKLSEHEKNLEDNERARKHGETLSFATEEKLELMISSLEEASNIAEDSDRKYEEVLRKAKIVEAELERINEKAEDFEQKSIELEDELRDTQEKLRKMEDICSKNVDTEDRLDNEQRSLIERLKIAETNAEFGERTVDKLESTIDGIQERLYEEKMNYKNLSMKLDTTLKEMMTIAEEAHEDCE